MVLEVFEYCAMVRVPDQPGSCTILDFGSHQPPVSPVVVASGEAKGCLSTAQGQWK